MNKEDIIQMLKDNPIKIIKCGDIEIPVEYLKQTTVNVNGDDYVRLQQENKRLKERIEYLERSNNRREDTILEQRKEISDLDDNWNKLKKYIRKTKLTEFEKTYGKRYGKTFTQAEVIVCNMITSKMRELEQGNNDNESV